MATTAYGTSGANLARRNNAIYWAVAIALIALIAFAIMRNRTVDTTVGPYSPVGTDANRIDRNVDTNAGTAPGAGTDNLNENNKGIGSPGTKTDTSTGNN